ncbi:coiled-coil domain-containing protein 166 [Coturnix japonica]|uniref:coiled-coil domain-containing protein 166 n=1 Tax=Coturnix japonica TaxID=93934 RepID=UPI0007770B88|nr:coiled-coil domain-containing protein 166 [Coturnix japonica]
MASKAKQGKQDSAGAGKNKEEPGIKDGDTSMETPVRERTLYLQEENRILTEHLNTYMGQVERFLRENKFLEEEAKQNRKESNIYLSYLTKHSQKCQNLIITLNEQNETDLSRVQKEKEELISLYAEKEKEVRDVLMEVETKYSLMNTEVEDLQPFKDMQLEQTKKIKELEKELLVTKIHHAEEMHKIKRRFLQAKADCEENSRQKILALTKRAEEAALQSLIEHIKQVKAENRHLRQELLRLIQCSKLLKEIQVELRDQHQQLLREKHCTQDMAHARHRLHQQEAHRSNQDTCSSNSPFKRGY